MHAQVDDDGIDVQILNNIVDCKKDSNVVDKNFTRLRTKIGQQRLRHTTYSWSVLILWNNGEEEWTLLECLKQSLALNTTKKKIV